MSVFATFRRSVGLASSASPDAAKSTPIKVKPVSVTSSSSENSGTPPRKNPDSFAQLILENSNGQEKAAYPIRKRNTKIGRLPTNDIRIYRETVSRIHCQIVIDQAGTATLHVLNPRGVKINGKDVELGEGAPRQFPLRQDDRIEIFCNFFRIHYARSPIVQADENDENAIPAQLQPAQQMKSVRMSLVRASVLPSKPESPAATKPTRTPLKSRRSGANSIQQDGVGSGIEQASTSKPAPARKGRRSLVFSTPKREAESKAPWTAEPSKRPQLPALGRYRQDSSPSKGSTGKEEEDSVVVMEEMEEIEQDEGEEDERIQDPPPTKAVRSDDRAPLTPPAKPSQKEEGAEEQRLTQSASPVKKPKRRSSFFGRAGVFANWNLGFYPEERKEEAEARDEDAEATPDDGFVTSPNGSRILPEPRLDDEGNPRLPMSLASATAGYTSPKRRVVSLRTATLLRQGQQAFEQQKLRSPPASPTKSSADEVHAARSLMDAMRAIVASSSPRKEQDEVKAIETTAPVADQQCDNDDEDEIDRSLSLVGEDEDEELNEAREESESRSQRPPMRRTFKPRLSESNASSLASGSRANQRKSRISMPAKLISISLVEGHASDDIEDLRAQWLAEQERGVGENHVDAVAEQAEAQLLALLDHPDEHSDTDSEMDDSIVLDTPQSSHQVYDGQAMDEEHEQLQGVEESAGAETEDVFGSQIFVSEQPDDDKENDWQVVSPRRQRWAAEERDVRNTRRNSEQRIGRPAETDGAAAVKRNGGKRRITAAPAFQSHTAREAIGAKTVVKKDTSAMFTESRPKSSRRVSYAAEARDTTGPEDGKARRRMTIAPTCSSAASALPVAKEVNEEGRINSNLVKFEEQLPVDSGTGRKGRRVSELPGVSKRPAADQLRRRMTAAPGFEYGETPTKKADARQMVEEADGVVEDETEAGQETAQAPQVEFQVRKPIDGRRISEAPSAMKKGERNALVRRTTAAGALWSSIATKQVNVASTVAKENCQITVSRSPAKRNASPDSIQSVTKEPSAVARTRSPVKRAKANVEIALPLEELENSVRKPRAAKVAAAAAIQSSPTKPSRAPSPEKRAVARKKASKPTLRDPNSATALPSTSECIEPPPSSSSPTKQTKRAQTQARQGKAGGANTLTAGPSARIRTELAATLQAGPSTDDGAVEQPVPRTTRSGRSVRKPADLGQPMTVVTQSDPAPGAGRTTRGRARRGG